MKIDMAALRTELESRLRNSNEEPGLEEVVATYGDADLHDPDTLLGLARALGVDLAEYEATPDSTDVFNTDDDAAGDGELGDLADDVDDLSGDYY